MNSLTPEIIEKTAKLAQLHISDEEKQALQADLAAIFPLFDALNKVEISALEPLAHPLDAKQRLRADQAVARDLLATIENNAPQFEDGFITVPKVIE
ncbi:Asp-tRNA(Asn)/Glu-tRNA(Gln) amidotransferase subunit GatC [Suttonella indologenes]|uniref:Aspartyl/glutamyl-tRNA(Asn/Gln) amidotransferase subunit C n=1 Tax=Suttonella indologenes TaxID=13276 RepID=A0A380MX70_9GAMM|nr:Asp-tRNA(Asn)/Glu-tRNA(Gln) amidotransferase subunit GatC [Suttonella indologenes]SUO96878.1 Glutamyl-tRNA(Gln) amidotransferase subunit C [Suttonella indologenes]